MKYNREYMREVRRKHFEKEGPWPRLPAPTRLDEMRYDFSDFLTYNWSVRAIIAKGLAVATLAAGGIFGINAIKNYEAGVNAQSAKGAQERSSQLKLDGFPMQAGDLSFGQAYDVEDGGREIKGREVFGRLTIGACSFHDITAEIIKNDQGHIVDIRDYTAPINFIGNNPEDGGVELNFQNTEELQQVLPSLDCQLSK